MGAREHMIKNISITVGIIANETSQTTVSQKEVFDSLAKVVLDNGIALDYILPEHGGICTLVKYCSRTVDQDIKILVMQNNAQ